MSEKKFVKNGKKLGVLGGLGPAAAQNFASDGSEIARLY